MVFSETPLNNSRKSQNAPFYKKDTVDSTSIKSVPLDVKQEQRPVLFSHYQSCVKLTLSPANGCFEDEKCYKHCNDWTALANDLSVVIEDNCVEDRVNKLPDYPLSFFEETESVSKKSFMQHAYVILSLIISAYLRYPEYNKYICNSLGEVQPRPFLMDKLSTPFLKVSEYLKTKPVISYQGVCLFNWYTHDRQIESFEDIRILYSFSGTSDEKYFYTIPLYIDYIGNSLLTSMNAVFEITNAPSSIPLNISKLTQLFKEINRKVGEINKVMKEMHLKCDPEVFQQFRFFFNGFNSGLYANGLRFGSAEDAPIVTAAGASAAQCPTIHILNKFICMKQCDFLESQLQMLSKDTIDIVNEVAKSSKTMKLRIENNEDLLAPFNKIIKNVMTFRKIHMNFIQKYIGNGKTGTGGTEQSDIMHIQNLTEQCICPHLKKHPELNGKTNPHKPSEATCSIL